MAGPGRGGRAPAGHRADARPTRRAHERRSTAGNRLRRQPGRPRRPGDAHPLSDGLPERVAPARRRVPPGPACTPRPAQGTPRKLSAADALNGIERGLDVKRRREEWRERAPALHARFGGRFRERETDWERLVADLEGTIAHRRSWKGGTDWLLPSLRNLTPIRSFASQSRPWRSHTSNSRGPCLRFHGRELFEGAAELDHLFDSSRLVQTRRCRSCWMRCASSSAISGSRRPTCLHWRTSWEAVLRLEAIPMGEDAYFGAEARRGLRWPVPGRRHRLAH